MENSVDLAENGIKEVLEAAENHNHIIRCDKENLVESSDSKVIFANGSTDEATENDKEIESNRIGDKVTHEEGDIIDECVEIESTENIQEINTATNGTNMETDKTDLANDGEIFPSMVVHQIVSREASVEPEPVEFTTSMASHHVSLSSDHLDLHQEYPDLHQNHQHQEIASMASAVSREIDNLVEKDEHVEINNKEETEEEQDEAIESLTNGDQELHIEDVVHGSEDTQETVDKDSEIPQVESFNSNEIVSEVPEKIEPEATIGVVESEDEVKINVVTPEEEVGEDADVDNLESFPSMLVHHIASQEASIEPKLLDSTISMTTHQIASRVDLREPKLLDSGTSMATHRISTSYDEDFNVPGVITIEKSSDLTNENTIDPDMPNLESFSSMVVHQIASREASMEPKAIDYTTSMFAHQVGSRETSMEPKIVDSDTSMASHRISATFDDNHKTLEEDKVKDAANLAPAVAKEMFNANECIGKSINECKDFDSLENEKSIKLSQEDNETKVDKITSEEIITETAPKVTDDIAKEFFIQDKSPDSVEEGIHEKIKNALQNQESDEDSTSGEETPIIAICTFGNNSGIVQDIKIENQARDNLKTPTNEMPSKNVDDTQLDEESIEEGQAITASCTVENNKPIVIETKIPEVNTNLEEESADKEVRDNYDKVSSEIITEIVNQRFSRNISNGDTVKEPEKIDKIEPSPKVEKKVETDLPNIEVITKEPTPQPESKPPKKSILETLFGCFGCFKGQKS